MEAFLDMSLLVAIIVCFAIIGLGALVSLLITKIRKIDKNKTEDDGNQ